jgi:electron transfer flavoprotein alpha subunit
MQHCATLGNTGRGHQQRPGRWPSTNPAHVPTDAFLLQAVADVVAVQDISTFVRPIYAGNALATVRVLGEGPRLLTVRHTAFAAASATGGGAAVEAVSAEELQAAQDAAGSSEWVGEDVRKSGAAAGGSGGPGAVCAPVDLEREAVRPCL